MVQQSARSSESSAPPDGLAVMISGSIASDALVCAGATLAKSLGLTFEAVYVETPEHSRDGSAGARAGDALAIAVREGGTVATIAAATLLDGIVEHLASSSVRHLVLEQNRVPLWKRLLRGSMLDALDARTNGVTFHVVPTPATKDDRDGSPRAGHRTGRPFDYALAALLVAATLAVGELLQLVTGPRSLDLLFLFPVIAVAARLGLAPALLAAGLSMFCYNFFLLAPAFSFDARAPQNVVMTTVLFAVAAYTSFVTRQIRGRLLLSDRSARENASLAALAQKLTRDADWEATALTLCEHVRGLFGLNAAVFREVGGKLVLAAADPAQCTLGPVDQAALDWSWIHGEEAGAGTASIAASDWQFQPLKTSLGTLAVLGLSREDGRDPIRPDQRVLLSTIVAQAALAHERLRLEDFMRAGAAAPGAG